MSQVLRRPPSRMTLNEFLAWEPGSTDGARWQLVDGEPVAMAPASSPHGEIQSELARLIGNHLLRLQSPCRLVSNPGIVPRVGSDVNYRIPDLGVTCARPTQDLMMPEPVLLVEILSPSNELETRANVWAYTTIPSVQEILIVDSTRMAAEMLRRQPDGSWSEQPERLGAPAELVLSGIGFSTPLAALYRTTFLAAV